MSNNQIIEIVIVLKYCVSSACLRCLDLLACPWVRNDGHGIDVLDVYR
jgi:hypothetical protein